MRRITVYILLSFYLFAQLKPLAVVIEDTLAHTFWRMQHMATVHFENGRYHVHTELSDILEKGSKTPQEKTSSSERSNESIQTIHEFNFNFQINSTLIPVAFHQTQDVIAGFTRINTPPPKIA